MTQGSPEKQNRDVSVGAHPAATYREVGSGSGTPGTVSLSSSGRLGTQAGAGAGVWGGIPSSPVDLRFAPMASSSWLRDSQPYPQG